ncbi:hypothetical protein AYR46_03085 [Sphingobium yanoikuyae]|nr:hypothetical protein AYR46_03085 [Sphingobium yanoikuyae]
MSQTVLAEKVGATLSMVGKLERGERKLTSTWIAKFSAALGCRPSELLEDASAPLPQGDILPGGLIEWRSDDDSIAEILELYPDDEFDEEWTPPTLRARSLMVSEQPATLTMPVGTQFVYDLGAGLLPIRCGELCVIFFSANEKMMVGVLMSGTSENTYHVLPLGGGILPDRHVSATIKISEILL